jgi:hypothetical protein
MSTRFCAVPLLLFVGLAGPAEAAGRTWLLRAEGGSAHYSREAFSSTSLSSQRLELDGGDGIGLAAECLVSSRIGLELSLSRIGLDAQYRRVETRPDPADPTRPQEVTVASDSGDFTLLPVAFGAYWHPLRSSRFDLYVGPQLAWVDYDLGLSGPPSRAAEWAFGGKLGVEARLGQSPWSAGVAFRYLDIQHEGLEHDLYTGIGLQVLSLGVSYRIGR